MSGVNCYKWNHKGSFAQGSSCMGLADKKSEQTNGILIKTSNSKVFFCLLNQTMDIESILVIENFFAPKRGVWYSERLFKLEGNVVEIKNLVLTMLQDQLCMSHKMRLI